MLVCVRDVLEIRFFVLEKKLYFYKIMIDEKDNNNLDSQLEENTEKESTIEKINFKVKIS